jgi:hypothetical protein
MPKLAVLRGLWGQLKATRAKMYEISSIYCKTTCFWADFWLFGTVMHSLDLFDTGLHDLWQRPIFDTTLGGIVWLVFLRSGMPIFRRSSQCRNMATWSVSPAPSYSFIVLTRGAMAFAMAHLIVT